MRTGLLRNRITIQEAYKEKNDFGEWIIIYRDWATIWAAIEPNQGKRYFEAAQANSEVQGIIRIRYRSGVLPTMRVKYCDRIFQIISIVHPQERMRELHIFYKEQLD